VPDEPRRHRVLAAAHHHLGVAVDPRGQGQGGVERLGRQRAQQLAFDGPVVPDAGRPVADAPPIVGVVGALQLDVLKERLRTEYSLPIEFETARFQVCRWVSADDKAKLDTFIAGHRGDMAEDLDGAPVFLAPSDFMLNYEMERAPKIVFSDVKDYQRHTAAA
jgi:peptide chain release factor 3